MWQKIGGHRLLHPQGELPLHSNIMTGELFIFAFLWAGPGQFMF